MKTSINIHVTYRKENYILKVYSDGTCITRFLASNFKSFNEQVLSNMVFENRESAKEYMRTQIDSFIDSLNYL